MALKTKKPTTPSQRWVALISGEELTRRKPEKSLLRPLKKSGGRNNCGRVTARYRGGGHKRHYRLIDFKRDKDSVAARVLSIEYDPNRSAHIALLQYRDGEKRYIIAPDGLQVGDTLRSGEDAELRVGNALPLRKIPDGFEVHCVELLPGRGAQMARSAGTGCQVMGKEKHYVLLKVPSGEVRKIHENCKATIGHVGNVEHENIVLGKAGRTRWLGRRPRTRAIAMNPVDHPMGGGEGRSKSGRLPCSPTGLLARGFKTRKPSKRSDRFIVQRRRKKKK